MQYEKEGNFVVFELKIRATEAEAQEDINKLKDYINILNYPLAVFVNVDDKKFNAEKIKSYL